MKKLIAALGLASTVLIVGCNNNKTQKLMIMLRLLVQPPIRLLLAQLQQTLLWI